MTTLQQWGGAFSFWRYACYYLYFGNTERFQLGSRNCVEQRKCTVERDKKGKGQEEVQNNK